MMDFVVKLPKSTDSATKVVYNSILVVVDTLTKYTHLVPWKKSGTASKLASVLLRKLVSYQELPKTIISDQDKLFTLKFWNM